MASVRERKYAEGLMWEGWYKDRTGRWRGFNTKIPVGHPKSKAGALELTAYVEGQVQAGVDPFRTKAFATGPTVGKLWADFLNMKKLTVRRGTVSLYQQTAKAWEETMDDVPVAQVDAEMLLNFAEKRLRQRTRRAGGRVQVSTVNRNLRDLRAFLRWCHERGEIEKIPRVRLLKEERTEIRFYSPPEILKLLNAARETTIAGRRLDVFLRVLLFSALRIGEALSLTWDDVDVRLRRMWIPGKRTKTGRPVFVPLSLRLVEALNELPTPRTGKLFPWSQTTGHLHECWQDAVKRAGVPYLKMHAMRHTAATMLVEAGLKPHQLQAMLHASLATTLQYYVGVDRDELRDAARKVNAGRYSTAIQRNQPK